MESTLSLQTNLYPRLTPAGAFYAVSSDTPSAGKTLLHGLLKADPGEVVSSEKLLAWADTSDIDTALNLLYRLQKLEFLYGDEMVILTVLICRRTIAVVDGTVVRQW